jgi:hypothetical protein
MGPSGRQRARAGTGWQPGTAEQSSAAQMAEGTAGAACGAGAGAGARGGLCDCGTRWGGELGVSARVRCVSVYVPAPRVSPSRWVLTG